MQEMPRKVALERLMQRSDLDGLEPHDALLLIGSIIDLGGDEKSVAALEHASGLLERYLAGEVPDRLACRAHYFRANIWSAKRYMSPDWESWVWKSDLINGEILELRRSVTHLGFIELSALEQAQILTNLGNILNHVGRFVEAIEYWDRALAAVPRFAMASGNRGIGLGHYANVVHDQGHGSVLLLSAWRALMAACDRDAILDSPVYGHAAQKHFGEYAASISARYDVASLARSFDFDNHPMGRGRRERAYRRWCLENRLFINPLNDVGPHPIAAQDVMMLPSITVGFGSHPGPPAIIWHFNIIKQEFCSARYALYEAISSSGVHFADRRVALYNTLDYPTFGDAVERMKAAFRSAYAVFDKISYALNVYLELGHADRRVNFRNLWFKRSNEKEGLHPALDGLANWPLRGLFWLAKDIFEEDFRSVIEPDARYLYDLRNHMEHKFVAVREPMALSTATAGPVGDGMFALSFSELAAKTLRQIKLGRAAIAYFALSIHMEERRRATASEATAISVPMVLGTWDDEWKRVD